MEIKRALLSVSDKTGIVEFAQGLHELGVELISTGGTMQQLKAAGMPAGAHMNAAVSFTNCAICF